MRLHPVPLLGKFVLHILGPCTALRRLSLRCAEVVADEFSAIVVVLPSVIPTDWSDGNAMDALRRMLETLEDLEAIMLGSGHVRSW